MVAIQSNNKVGSAQDKAVQIKSGSGYSLSKLPGIGLHLNALASTSGGKAEKEAEHLEGQQINTPRIIKPCTSLTQAEAPPDNGSSQHSLEGALVLWSDEAQVNANTHQTSCLIGEESDPSSPKNKRHVLIYILCNHNNCISLNKFLLFIYIYLYFAVSHLQAQVRTSWRKFGMQAL